MAYEYGQVVDAGGAVVFARAVRPKGFFSRLRGLIGRKPLNDSQAWWFTRCASVHTLGMRHAIDVVHLDAQARVLCIRESVRPLSMSAAKGGKQVLELAQGNAERAGLYIGQELRFNA